MNNSAEINDQFLLNSSTEAIYRKVESTSDLNYKDLRRLLIEFASKGNYTKVEKIAEYFLTKPNSFNLEPDHFNLGFIAIIAFCALHKAEYERAVTICKPFLNYNKYFEDLLGLYLIAASSYRHLHEYILSFELYHKILTILKNELPAGTFEKYHIGTLVNIGNLFYHIGDYTKAIQYHDEAFSMLSENKMGITKSIFLTNYAILKLDANKIDSKEAIKMLLESEKIASEAENIFLVNKAKITRLEFYIKNEELIEAKRLLNEIKSSGASLNVSILNQVKIAELDILDKSGQLETFLVELEASLDMLDTLELPKEGIRLLQNALKQINHTNNANRINLFNKKLIDILEKEYNSKHASNLNVLESQVELRLKEKELDWFKQLTDAKEQLNEMLSKKNKELLAFASITAHDIKAPVRTINSFIKILANKIELTQEDEELFNFIEKAGLDINRLVDDMLTFAKSGNYNSKAEVISISDIIESVEQNLHKRITSNLAKIEIENELPKLKVHNTAMIQLFQNIIDNSIKFTEVNKTPLIKISSSQTNNYISLFVKDNGLGISQDKVKNIFKPLYRIHDTAQVEGYGLGLATCAKIAEFYNGEIEVNSELGKGTCFEIRFPIAMAC